MKDIKKYEKPFHVTVLKGNHQFADYLVKCDITKNIPRYNTFSISFLDKHKTTVILNLESLLNYLKEVNIIKEFILQE